MARRPRRVVQQSGATADAPRSGVLGAVLHRFYTAIGQAWRERMGVEPTHDAAGRRATVLKTAETTGPPPLPHRSVPESRGMGNVRPRSYPAVAGAVPSSHETDSDGARPLR